MYLTFDIDGLETLGNLSLGYQSAEFKRVNDGIRRCGFIEFFNLIINTYHSLNKFVFYSQIMAKCSSGVRKLFFSHA